MSLVTAFSFTTHLLCLALFLQAIEIYAVSRDFAFLKVWSFEKSKLNLKWISLAQIFLALAGFFMPSGLFFVSLFFTHLGICVRFRGTFNGGSDMMTFVVLTGVIVGTCLPNENAAQFGLIYIAIHLLYSYFKAGLVKALRPEWRNGRAISEFLRHSFYDDIRKFSEVLIKTRNLGQLLGICAVGFELSFPLVLFFPALIWAYLGCALAFHFLIFLAFGLNRFFWIWLSAWPAAVYFSTIHLEVMRLR